MLLAAAERGLGGCILGWIRRDKLRQALKIPDYFTIVLTIALGEPNETIVLEDLQGDSIDYWRDDDDVHHVPKRTLEELLVEPSA